MSDNLLLGLVAIEEGWVCIDLLNNKLEQESNDKNREEIKESYRATHDAESALAWCKSNCKGQHVSFAGKYYFKLDEDATWFSLVWL